MSLLQSMECFHLSLHLFPVDEDGVGCLVNWPCIPPPESSLAIRILAPGPCMDSDGPSAILELQIPVVVCGVRGEN